MEIIYTKIFKNIFYNIVASLLFQTNYFSFAILFGQVNYVILCVLFHAAHVNETGKRKCKEKGNTRN